MWAFSRVWTSGKEGSAVEWMRIEEEPEAERIWVCVQARAKTSVGCAVEN